MRQKEWRGRGCRARALHNGHLVPVLLVVAEVLAAVDGPELEDAVLAGVAAAAGGAALLLAGLRLPLLRVRGRRGRRQRQEGGNRAVGRLGDEGLGLHVELLELHLARGGGRRRHVCCCEGRCLVWVFCLGLRERETWFRARLLCESGRWSGSTELSSPAERRERSTAGQDTGKQGQKNLGLLGEVVGGERGREQRAQQRLLARSLIYRGYGGHGLGQRQAAADEGALSLAPPRAGESGSGRFGQRVMTTAGGARTLAWASVIGLRWLDRALADWRRSARCDGATRGPVGWPPAEPLVAELTAHTARRRPPPESPRPRGRGQEAESKLEARASGIMTMRRLARGSPTNLTRRQANVEKARGSFPRSRVLSALIGHGGKQKRILRETIATQGPEGEAASTRRPGTRHELRGCARSVVPFLY